MSEREILEALERQIEENDLHLGDCIFLSDVLDLFDRKYKEINALKSNKDYIVNKIKECMLEEVEKFAENMLCKLCFEDKITPSALIDTVRIVAQEMRCGE